MLSPEADANHYDTVQSGETLSWIADLYDVPLADLMTWNGLNNTSVIYADQKLLLLITPPATPTLTPAPATTIPSPQPSITQSLPTATPTEAPTEIPARGFNLGLIMGVIIIVVAVGGLFWWRLPRRS